MHKLVSRRDIEGRRRRRGKARRIGTAPLLVGYSPFSPLDPLGGRQLEHQGWSVVTWPVKFAPPPSGSEILIPSGLVDLQIKSTLWDRRTDQWVSSQYGGSVEIAARPPQPIHALDDVAASVLININATNYQLTVSGGRMHPKGYVEPGEEIETFTNPTGTLKVNVPDAGRFSGPNGELLFHLRVKKLTSGDESALAKTVTCKFEDVQISLKGTVR
jgi:hypothetical protein